MMMCCRWGFQLFVCVSSPHRVHEMWTIVINDAVHLSVCLSRDFARQTWLNMSLCVETRGGGDTLGALYAVFPQKNTHVDFAPYLGNEPERNLRDCCS